jgi:Spy/CpxP family protein refolding chaperone|eukprot:gene8731-10730_t
MRKMMILAMCAAFPLATSAAYAQTAAPATQQPASKAPAQSGAVPITTINIVDINELPESTKTQVNDAVAKRSDKDMQQLRTSIDASPQVSAALKEKGLTSAAVVVASLDAKGLLTLVTKKPS